MRALLLDNRIAIYYLSTYLRHLFDYVLEITTQNEVNMGRQLALFLTSKDEYLLLDYLASIGNIEILAPAIEDSKGKIEDYKLFVVIYIDYENSLPQKIQAYMRYSPCGRAKMEALMIRAFVQSDPVTLA